MYTQGRCATAATRMDTVGTGRLFVLDKTGKKTQKRTLVVLCSFVREFLFRETESTHVMMPRGKMSRRAA